MKTKLAGLALALLLATAAPAAIEVELSGITANAGNFTWTYEAFLTNSTLRSNDYFKIYDFAGYVSGTANASDLLNWVGFSAPYSDPAVPPPDNPGIPNITFVYFGGDITQGAGRLSLGTFHMDSIYSGQTPGFFGWSADIMTDEGSGAVAVPIPEPSAVIPLSTLALGLWFRRRL